MSIPHSCGLVPLWALSRTLKMSEVLTVYIMSVRLLGCKRVKCLTSDHTSCHGYDKRCPVICIFSLAVLNASTLAPYVKCQSIYIKNTSESVRAVKDSKIDYTPALKGMVRIFWNGVVWGTYPCQCITYSIWRSACSQFGETARSTSTETKQCTAVDGGSIIMFFRHLKNMPTKKNNQYQCKCVLYLEYFQRFTFPSDSPFLWYYIFSIVELPYSYSKVKRWEYSNYSKHLN